MINQTLKIGSILLASLLMVGTVQAQQKSENDKAIRSISVSGKAEREVLPDEIYFDISLREYSTKSGSKFMIAELEKQLVAAVKKAGIPAENLTVQNVYGYNYNYGKKEENKEFMARKQFQLKLSDGKMLNQILSQLDPKSIEYSRISQYTHSKIKEIEQELQIEAVKNAKAKAEALLNPLGEKLGRVIEVQENRPGYQPVYYFKNQNNNMRSMAMMDESSNMESNVEFQKIKVEAEVNIVFSIQ